MTRFSNATYIVIITYNIFIYIIVARRLEPLQQRCPRRGGVRMPVAKKKKGQMATVKLPWLHVSHILLQLYAVKLQQLYTVKCIAQITTVVRCKMVSPWPRLCGAAAPRPSEPVRDLRLPPNRCVFGGHAVLCVARMRVRFGASRRKRAKWPSLA